MAKKKKKMAAPGPSAAITCAENIAFLRLLGEIPSSPSHIAVPFNDVPEDARRTLPFSRERRLCQGFAFLACVSEDSNRIPAVCIEEDPTNDSLKVVLAVNKAARHDGQVIMERVKRGFEDIFEALSRADNPKNSSSLRERLFSSMIQLCSQKILSRLRIRGRTGQSIVQHLDPVITWYSAPRRTKTDSSAAAAFLEKAREVIKRHRAWTHYQTNTSLEKLVGSIHELRNVRQWKQFIMNIPNQVKDPSSRSSLVDMIRKVAHYHYLARYLVRSARKFPILQKKASVVLVDLGDAAFERPEVSNHFTLQSTCERMAYQTQIGTICRKLNTTEHDARRIFSEKTQKILTESKIHAEVQLVYHYLTNPNPCELRPRVVCSSKEACFLCNELISKVSIFHTPGCHGRLYPGWRLPLIPTHETLAKQFNNALEIQIRTLVFSLLNKKKKRNSVYPNESILSSLPVSRSTLLLHDKGDVVMTAVMADEEDIDMVQKRGSQVSSQDTLKGASEGLEKTESQSKEDRETDRPDENPHRQGDDRSGLEVSRDAADAPKPSTLESDRQKTLSSHGSTIDSDSDSDADLDSEGKEDPTTIKDTLQPGEDSQMYSNNDGLEIQVENAMMGSSAGTAARRVFFDLSWLTTQEAQHEADKLDCAVVDARAIEGEIQYRVGRNREIFVAHGRQVARIRLLEEGRSMEELKEENL